MQRGWNQAQLHLQVAKTRNKQIQVFSVLGIPTSSRLKRTPPIGAPNATDTPAAEAADNT